MKKTILFIVGVLITLIVTSQENTNVLDTIYQDDSTKLFLQQEYAIAYYKDLIQKNPDNYKNRQILLNIYYTSRQFDQAFLLAKETISVKELRKNVKSIYFLSYLGYHEIVHDNITEANKYFQEIISFSDYLLEKDPNEINGIINKAYFLGVLNKKQEALTLIENARPNVRDFLKQNLDILYTLIDTFDMDIQIRDFKSLNIEFLPYDIITEEIFKKKNEVVLKYRNYDFLAHNYTYLDSSHRITMTDQEFEFYMNKYNFIPDRIKDYEDSISVAMMAEFDNWTIARMANRRISFSWLRLSYYLWLSEENAQLTASFLGFDHPYKAFEHLYYKDTSNWDNQTKSFFKYFRNRIHEATHNHNVFDMSPKQVLGYALVENPERKKHFLALQEKRYGKAITAKKRQSPPIILPKPRINYNSGSDIKKLKNKDYLYIDFDEINGSDTMTVQEKNEKVIMFNLAYNRINENISVMNGLYHFEVKSGKEIGISEELYTVFYNLYKYINTVIIEEQKKTSNMEVLPKLTPVDTRFWTWDMLYDLYKKYYPTKTTY